MSKTGEKRRSKNEKAAKLTSAFLSLLLGASPLLTTTIPAVANEARAGQDDALTGEVIDVTEYGADPSGYKDSSPAIIEAIAAAKEKTDAGESVTLSFQRANTISTRTRPRKTALPVQHNRCEYQRIAAHHRNLY
ncbi:hypothetical protein [Allobaculum sp. Allo2]|uniref:hypothetical protein n=1 Tax=Allobaculum sp. Allo2 TaxID=2853432 RepID=UPI001F600A45|nr:hypothetical protein [Allobaculum sp. Allo2]UNT94227.1 hypothetical protein KWG61_06350 [Allobaculum sp. Allo2]